MTNLLLEEVNIGVAAYPPLNLTTIAAIKTVPSSKIPKTASYVTSALISQIAVIIANTSNQELIQAVESGSGVVTRPNKSGVFVIGGLALSPNHLEKAGVIKPGSSAFVSSLLSTVIAKVPKAQDEAESIVRSTPYFTQADIDSARQLAKNKALAPENIIPESLFIDSNLQQVVGSLEKQIAILISNLEQAIPALIASGILTGSESASTISGMILSTVESCTTLEAGISQTVSAVNKIVTGQPVSYIPSGIPNIFGSPLEIMSAGLSAGKLSTFVSVVGPLLQHLIGLGLTGDPEQLISKAVLAQYPKFPSDGDVNPPSNMNSSRFKDIPWTTMTQI